MRGAAGRTRSPLAGARPVVKLWLGRGRLARRPPNAVARSLEITQAVADRLIPLGQLVDVVRPLFGIILQAGVVVLNALPESGFLGLIQHLGERGLHRRLLSVRELLQPVASLSRHLDSGHDSHTCSIPLLMI